MTYRSPTVDVLYGMNSQSLRTHLAGLMKEAKDRIQWEGNPAIHAALTEELAAVELLLAQTSRTACERLMAALEASKRAPTGDHQADVVAELDDPGPSRPETPAVGEHAPGRLASPAQALTLPDPRDNSRSGAPGPPARPPARPPAARPSGGIAGLTASKTADEAPVEPEAASRAQAPASRPRPPIRPKAQGRTITYPDGTKQTFPPGAFQKVPSDDEIEF